MKKLIIAAVLMVGACGDPASVNSTNSADPVSEEAVDIVRSRFTGCLTAAGYDLEDPRAEPSYVMVMRGTPEEPTPLERTDERNGTDVFLMSPSAGQIGVFVFGPGREFPLPHLDPPPYTEPRAVSGIYPKEREDAEKLKEAGCRLEHREVIQFGWAPWDVDESRKPRDPE